MDIQRKSERIVIAGEQQSKDVVMSVREKLNAKNLNKESLEVSKVVGSDYLSNDFARPAQFKKLTQKRKRVALEEDEDIVSALEKKADSEGAKGLGTRVQKMN